MVVSLADDPDDQTAENLQVVTLGFNRIVTSLSDPEFIIDEQVGLDSTVSAYFEDIHDLLSSLVRVKNLNQIEI